MKKGREARDELEGSKLRAWGRGFGINSKGN